MKEYKTVMIGNALNKQSIVTAQADTSNCSLKPQKWPRGIRVSSNPAENSVKQVEQLLMTNKYMHHSYKPQLESVESLNYLKKLQQVNTTLSSGSAAYKPANEISDKISISLDPSYLQAPPITTNSNHTVGGSKKHHLTEAAQIALKHKPHKLYITFNASMNHNVQQTKSLTVSKYSPTSNAYTNTHDLRQQKEVQDAEQEFYKIKYLNNKSKQLHK